MFINLDFNPFIGEDYNTSLLPVEEMTYIHHQVPNSEQFVVGVQWVEATRVMKFLMGNFSTITIPCECLPLNERCQPLDFECPSVENYGFVIKFGEDEIDARNIIYLDM